MNPRSTLHAARKGGRRALLLSAGVALVVTSVHPAWAAPPLAQPPAPASSPAHEEAKALTQKAAIAFKLAHFDEALDLYSRAYEKVPLPALLFNIGQCHKNLGHSERALFFFQGYLRDKPDAANRPAVEILVADLTKTVAAERQAKIAAEAQQTRDSEVAVANAEKEASEARVAALREAEKANLPPPIVAEPPMHRNRPLLIAGTAAAAVGVGLLATGAYFGLHANSDASSLSSLSTNGGTWNAHEQSVFSNGQSSARAATGMFVAGGVLVAGGATVAIFGLQKHPDGTSLTASIAPSPTGSSLVISGCF